MTGPVQGVREQGDTFAGEHPGFYSPQTRRNQGIPARGPRTSRRRALPRLEPAPMTDRADRIYERLLVLRSQAGDEAAFEGLVARYSPAPLLPAEDARRDPSRYEDALQDVWFAVFRKVPRLVDPGAFPAWIYRIARDRAFRELRKQKTYRRNIEVSEFGGKPADDESVSVEDVEWIHDVLDKLEPEHREVLVLRFLEEMSYAEIARVTGCQLGTVRSRIHYAKRAGRRRFREDELT